MDEVTTHLLALGGKIGTVGNTANAKNTRATIYPRPWKIDDAPDGFIKMLPLKPYTPTKSPYHKIFKA